MSRDFLDKMSMGFWTSKAVNYPAGYSTAYARKGRRFRLDL